jgi:CHASE1-domain containing sensor protein
VTTGGGRTGGRSGSETSSSRPTLRRLRSAFFLWRSSMRTPDMIAAVVLVVLSLLLGGYLYTRAQGVARAAFAEKARHLQAAIGDRATAPVADLKVLQSFFEASNGMTRRQFRVLTGPLLLRDRLVYAFEWLPAVPAAERLGRETQARAEGVPGYRIWEPGPGGKPRDVIPRRLHLPIFYMEPPNAGALGFDIASDPERLATAERARDSGTIAASPPFRLVEETPGRESGPAFALYAPIYQEKDPGSMELRRADLSGFALAIVRVSALVETAASAADASGLGYVVRDVGTQRAPILAQRPPAAESVPRRSGFELDFPVAIADRSWTLSAFPMPKAFVPVKRGAFEVATIGALSALLGLVMATALRTIVRLRRQVEKVGPYRLVARLGHGAMGVVWEARHALLRRPTAVKLLAPGTEGERALARFEREVQLTAGLTHPSTIAIYDYGRTSDGVFYYAMELINGINLLQLVGFDGPLAPSRVVHLLRQACGALAEAHAAGLIHRDIKPANLMISVYGGIPDFLKVLDFGLVKDIGAAEIGNGPTAAAAPIDPGLSHDGTLLGTPLYMSPEGMSDPAHVDARTDLFALGAVGYFLLTGHSPYPGRTAIEVFAMERRGPPPRLAQASPKPVPRDLEEALMACLSFDREKRPASAEALDAMLEACAVEPWTRDMARAWWRERGASAMEGAQAERREASQALQVSARGRSRS